MKKKSGQSDLKNIGPTIKKRLNEIGVYNRQDLKRVGAARAYRKIRAKYPKKTIPSATIFTRLKEPSQGSTGTTFLRQSKIGCAGKARLSEGHSRIDP